jgi:NADH:ubiquinone reductase (H+-translocating)
LQQPPKHVLILGSGFAGIEVVKRVQKKFKNNKNVVSKDSYFLFTPMLPEVASGIIETRHIVTPVKEFCKKARFYEANVESIDLDNKKVVITHAIGRQSNPSGWDQHLLKYDLVIALGSENNFFKMFDIQKHPFTMKNICDAIILRNHTIKNINEDER